METSKVAKSWKKRSIYNIPACDKERNEKAFTPQVVSLGPYHCENKELKMRMYDHKRRALHHFLKRSKPLETYVEALQNVLPDLMDCYDSLRVDKDTFLQLMLIDGSFLLEILRANKVICSADNTYVDYCCDDPIFSYHGKVYVMPHIKRDMLMLENQLPMLLLVNLVTTENSEIADPVKYLNDLILKYIVGPSYKSPTPNAVMDSLHVLDLYRKSLLGLGREPSQVMAIHPRKHKHAEDIVRSAEKLHESGIEFEKSESTSLVDIEFDGQTLKLPTIVVDDTTESAFLNLIAFERLHVGAGNEVTSYVSFMDTIIDSAKDVSILHCKGIIHNAIGSEKVIANLFNGITKDVTPDPENRLHWVHVRLDDYCSRKRNQSFAHLRHTYFKSPWALISLLAAIFLVLLTITQAVYAVISYHLLNDKNPTPPPPPPHRSF